MLAVDSRRYVGMEKDHLQPIKISRDFGVADISHCSS